MLGRTNTGGGGGGLNFRVVGGTTQPTNPKENTIWVNTNTAITDWVFSAEQPTAASGRVWISTGASSPVEFNALKKNGIQVYPLSAKQYVSGVWRYVAAKSYQGGKWVNWVWVSYLYNSGDKCEDITGGWSSSGYSGGGVEVTSATYGTDRITFTGTNNAHNVACTNNPIDLSKYSKLKFFGAVTADGSYDGRRFGLTVAISKTKDFSNSAAQMPLLKGTYDGENAALDISGVSEKFYVAVFAEGLPGISGYMTKLELA